MRQNASNRRSRGRSGRKSGGNPRNQVFDSNGPGARVRGNAAQIYEKYQQLARDAASGGDRIAAENLYQHAEHYFRLMMLHAPKPDSGRDGDGDSDDNETGQGDGNGRDRQPDAVYADDGDSGSDGGGRSNNANGNGGGEPRRRRRRANGSNGADDSGDRISTAASDDPDGKSATA